MVIAMLITHCSLFVLPLFSEQKLCQERLLVQEKVERKVEDTFLHNNSTGLFSFQHHAV